MGTGGCSTIMLGMQAPFRIRRDISREIDHGFAFPLGVVSGGQRPRTPGWCRVIWDEDETHPETMTYTIVVSHEMIRPLLHEFLRLLPPRVFGLLELGSRDAFREVDVFIGEEVDVDRFLGAWDFFESILLEDAMLGVGVNSRSPFLEIFLDPDKRLILHIEPGGDRVIEGILNRFGIERRHDEDIQSVRNVKELKLRPVLEQRPGCMLDSDHLLLELRSAWALLLDDDPDRNLDARGRDIGFTLWHGLAQVDQEDPAGRRIGQASVWGVATCRRDMAQLVRAKIAADEEWEFLEVLNLDRVAMDNRPTDLDGLQTPLTDAGVLLYDVEAVGTTPAAWDGRDG